MKPKVHLDRIGVAGLVVTAMLSPCCFPLFAFIASGFGLGSLELFGGWTKWVFLVLVWISITGLAISYFRHRCLYPLTLSVVGGFLITCGYFWYNGYHWQLFVYSGMFLLFVATIWNYRQNKLHHGCCSHDLSQKDVEVFSIIRCPKCGFEKKEEMPVDACVYYYQCERCSERLEPIKGDCCVFCSYGSVKCPPIQAGNNCC